MILRLSNDHGHQAILNAVHHQVGLCLLVLGSLTFLDAILARVCVPSAAYFSFGLHERQQIAEMIQVKMSYDMKMVGPDLGYFFESIVA